MKAIATAALVLLGGCLVACGGGDSGCSGPGDTGGSCSAPTGSATVRGVLERVGGPLPGSTPLSGTVVLTAESRSYQVSANASGRFAVHVAAGSYDVTGTSPRVNRGRTRCTTAREVRVPAADVVHVRVICSIR